jgi:hypothetical protein
VPVGVGGCGLQPIDARISRAQATLSLPSPFLFISSKLHFHLLQFFVFFSPLFFFFDSSPEPPAHRVHRSLTTPIASVDTVLALHIFRPLVPLDALASNPQEIIRRLDCHGL